MTWQEDLHHLCEAVVEDRLTAEQLQRLEQLVMERPEARRFYVEYMHQHACLHWTGAAAHQPEAQAREDQQPSLALRAGRKQSRRRWWAAAFLAASVVLALAVWLMRPASAHVATLISARSCKWDGGTLPTEVGAQLGRGRLRLAEGIAGIRFSDGAEVTLEAPADLELVSPQRCILHSGRLVAHVPTPAIGFVVDTPTAVLKDLGTEFGVNVRDDRTADVQVFNGIVDVQHRASGQTERLLTGRNRRFATENVTDFDPQAEPAAGGSSPPLAEGARRIHISTAMGRGKDAYVQPLFPSEHSSDILLLVKNTKRTSDYNRKAYVAFDLAPATGTKVIEAQLSFTFTPTGMGYASEVPDATFAVYGLTDETLDSWDEKKMRWADAPGNAPGGAAVDPAKTARLGTFEIAQGTLEGSRSISGQALVDFLNRDTNGLATFILVRETLGSGRADLVHGFAAKRHPSLPPPTLKLTVMPRGN
jgi:ferric-dicitrate binding protein FerR (iron transport regulator)